MTKLEKMIKELCQDGAEYKTIEEICENVFSGGTPKTSVTEYYDGDIPWLRSGEINFNVIKETEKFITEKGLVESSAKWIRKNSVLIALTGATVARSAVNEIPLTANQSVCAMETKEEIINYKYLYYCIENMYNNIKGMAQGALTSINLGIIKKLSVPVPPLEVQREIVRILDNFTELTAEITAEITAELTARKKQYEYYRDTVLTFDDDVPMVKLGDIATDIYRGAGIKRDEVTPDGIPCVRYGEIYTSYNISFTECISHTSKDVVTTPKYFEHGDIIFTITGESVEEIAKSIAYLGHEKCMAGGDTVVMKHNQEPRYISYALSTTAAQVQKSKGKVKSKVVHSSVPALKEIKIPLPDMETQKRIADLLDNFHKLCNDISEGLPAEIEARQKQFEYYRDKLLTFESA